MTVAAPSRHLTSGLLAQVLGVHSAAVVATEPGLVAGLGLLDPEAAPVAVGRWNLAQDEGASVEPGEPIVEIRGSAAEIGAAEDYVVGHLGFAGGIAKHAANIVAACPPDLRVACGGWKKLPAPLKPALRAGLAVAGVRPRLLDGDFVYVPKNTVLLFGGLVEAVEAGLRLDHGPVAVQVTDVDGALTAVRHGAGAVMVDTGTLHVLEAVDEALRAEGIRERVTVGFGGGVTRKSLTAARAAGADVVDVGRAVLDAPLWDLRVEVRT